MKVKNRLITASGKSDNKWRKCDGEIERGSTTVPNLPSHSLPKLCEKKQREIALKKSEPLNAYAGME